MPRSRRPNHRRRCPANLVCPPLSSHKELSVVGGLWNCRSAIQKADFITAYAKVKSLHFLALTETWITPDNTATPAALSAGYSFSHTPRASGRGGGTGLLISTSWKFSIPTVPCLNISSFEFHAVTVTHPSALNIVVLYRPPGPLGAFLDELDTLLSSFPEDGTPNNLLDPHQSGFRTGHSTETALLAVTEALATARASSLSSVLILLDLSAAFDTVNQQLLISTLAEMGISETALSWFVSYLTDRSYQVSWKGSVSAPHPVYRSPAGICTGSSAVLYVKERISACLTDISEWMATHHLKLNLDKTELLFMPYKTSPLHDLSITVDGIVVAASRSARNPGVVLDDRLDFKEHIRATARSCRFLLYNQEDLTVPAHLLHPASCPDHVAARIRFKVLTLAYTAANRTGPAYLQDLIQNYVPTRPLRSSTAWRLALPPLHVKGSRSSRLRSFSTLAPQWWNELPIPLCSTPTLPAFCRGLKTHLFRLHLD
ncbi:hypothetical protein SKAU_G00207970 [Synaphobranchus kaupii]|uniref:Reverse transcriptase domain-containing protein n=1 Tax=Synaphobranchus kaupii TaxID=118154 RepID=A0A9Q1F8G2_SYNKA|nr:hypothetical protein SKAU_G00207970 [Synaphobranchus kaupii]